MKFGLGYCVYGMVALAAVLIGATPSSADSIEDKVQVCTACHGEAGKPTDKSIPVIWGQQTGYIYIQLRDFKRGDRKSDIMQPIASTFERADMMAIADYFSKRTWPDLGQPRAPKDVSQRSQTANGSGGCTGCHLSQLQGASTLPPLAGQGRDYLNQTMLDFRTHARGNNPGMSDLMNATSTDDLAALAQY